MSGHGFSAVILQNGAGGIAGYAASLVLERHPEVGELFAPKPLDHWKTHFRQRILDLAAALTFDEPRLFLSRIDWERRAWRARDLPERVMAQSLACLREVVGEELPDAAASPADDYLRRAIESLEREPGEDEPELNPGDPKQRLALEYLTAVLEGDVRGGMEVVLSAVEEGLPFERAYLDVVLPAQREVGRLWHAGQLGIHEEHLVTSTTRRLLDRLVGERPARAGQRSHGDLLRCRG